MKEIEVHEVRCAVCRAPLGMTYTKDVAPRRVYCPDRMCVFYAAAVRNQADTPEFNTYVFAVLSMTEATQSEVASTFGDETTGNVAFIVRGQKKRWNQVP